MTVLTAKPTCTKQSQRGGNAQRRTWTFLPWQLGPARVVGNWQRGNSPPTKTARGLTKHRFMGMCLWVWLKGGSWKIMQHLNHQFGLPKEWTRNKNTCAVIWRYLLACCLSPQGSRMRHWVYQRDTTWLNCLSLHFTCQKSPCILKLCSFTIHVHLYESTINWYHLHRNWGSTVCTFNTTNHRCWTYSGRL